MRTLTHDPQARIGAAEAVELLDPTADLPAGCTVSLHEKLRFPNTARRGGRSCHRLRPLWCSKGPGSPREATLGELKRLRKGQFVEAPRCAAQPRGGMQPPAQARRDPPRSVSAALRCSTRCGASRAASSSRRMSSPPRGTPSPSPTRPDSTAEVAGQTEGASRAGDKRSSPWLGRCVRCLLYTSPSPRDQRGSRMPSSA